MMWHSGDVETNAQVTTTYTLQHKLQHTQTTAQTAAHTASHFLQHKLHTAGGPESWIHGRSHKRGYQ